MTTPDDVRERLEADGHRVTQTNQADKTMHADVYMQIR
jgi:hypothetical protein